MEMKAKMECRLSSLMTMMDRKRMRLMAIIKASRIPKTMDRETNRDEGAEFCFRVARSTLKRSKSIKRKTMTIGRTRTGEMSIGLCYATLRIELN